MAKQLGIFPIAGTLDNITFFQTADGGFRVRKKTRLTGAMMAAMPAFDRNREHNREFGRAVKAMKVLRSSVKELLANTTDRKSALRLQQVLFDALKSDTTSIRGERSPQNGDLSLLNGFDFNASALLDTVVSAPFTTTINRATGALGLSVPAFNPTILLAAPPQATHFKVLLGGAAVDFATEEVESDIVASADLPFTNAITTPLTLTANITANTTKSIFVLLGIRFYEETNGIKYPIHSHNALAIVDLDQ
jgi:hypothetical protein